MHVGLVTRSLLYGGTERQLVQLARGLRERGHRVSVLQLYGDSDFGQELDAAGVERSDLGLRGRADVLKLARRALAWRRTHRPEVLHGFHIESNLLALLLGRSLAGTRVVWGIRAGDPIALARDRAAHAAARIHQHLVRTPDLVVSNSHAGARWAIAAGAAPPRLRVIANGVDTRAFRDDQEGRMRVRAQWGIGSDEPLVGCVARLEPRKGPELFLRAAAALAAERPDARFVWIGDGDPSFATALRHLSHGLGIDRRLVWAGVRRDMPAVHSALDLETLLSPLGEGSSNAVSEAMACRRLCVVADTGDSARLVGEHGIVVSTLEPESVAAAWQDGLRSSTEEARDGARKWIEREFSLPRMLGEYEAALLGLL